MIGIDTNVILRYLLQDDPIQSPAATALIEGQLSETRPGFVSTVAMVEMVWVLTRAYRFTNLEIAAVIERLLQVGVLVIENAREVFAAMALVKSGRGSFADALIGAFGAGAGCTQTVTFDKAALRLDAFGPVSA